MNVERELKDMAGRVFTDEWLEKLVRECPKSAARCQLEKESARQWHMLAPVLSAEQLATMGRLDDIYRCMRRCAVRFCFGKGVYACMQHAFGEQVESVYSRYVWEPLNAPKENAVDTEYEALRNEADRLADLLAEQMQDDEQREQFRFVESELDEQLDGAMRMSFYLGYRTGIKLLELDYSPAMAASMQEKLLLVEYQLGFVRTWQEREEDAALQP